MALALGGLLLAASDARLGYLMLAAQGIGIAALWVTAVAKAANGLPADLSAAALTLLAALMVLALDLTRIACVKGALEHFIQPHALWHVLSALLLYYLYRYERSLERGIISAPRD